MNHSTDGHENQDMRDAGVKSPRICFVLSYRAPDYIRGRSICESIQQAGNVELIRVVNRSPGFMRYWETIRALIRQRNSAEPDVYILGFRGHEIAWLVRWLMRGKPLVFDAMMSPYSALVDEGKLRRPGRLLAPLWRRYERAVLHRADLVLADTALHARYYAQEFSVPLEKILVIPVGAVERPPTQTAGSRASGQNTFRVLFYGSFLPLHGVDRVIEAAARLAELPIEFRFIGGSRAQAAALEAACVTRGIRYSHVQWVAFDQLLDEEIQRADLCLGGPFGGTTQARRVVTGKTSQCLALGRATVIGRIEEDYGFRDRVNCLLVEQADVDALAAAIRWAYDNRSQLQEIGNRGKCVYRERLSLDVIAQRLVPALRRLAS